jgi:hypothetical protein
MSQGTYIAVARLNAGGVSRSLLNLELLAGGLDRESVTVLSAVGYNDDDSQLRCQVERGWDAV